jgi:hypothetical protein
VAGRAGAVRELELDLRVVLRLVQGRDLQRVLVAVQARCERAGDLEWTVSVDSTITRVHQHGGRCGAIWGAGSNYRNPRDEEPPDHAIGKSRE